MSYKILAEDTPSRLESAVQSLISEGWEPCGGVSGVSEKRVRGAGMQEPPGAVVEVVAVRWFQAMWLPKRIS